MSTIAGPPIQEHPRAPKIAGHSSPKYKYLGWLDTRNINRNKKVLLAERKRHTARHVESTPSVVLTGYPHTDLAQGGTLPGGTLLGYPLQGTPQQGTPSRVPPRSLPHEFWVMLQSIMGYGYPPRCLPHGILGNVAKHYGICTPSRGQTDGWADTCQNITFPSYYVRGQ